MDSITGAIFVKVVNDSLQIDLETTSIFDYTSVNELSDYILLTWDEKITELLSQSKSQSQRNSHLLPSVPAGHYTCQQSSKHDSKKNINFPLNDNSAPITFNPIAIIAGILGGIELREAFGRRAMLKVERIAVAIVQE